MKLKTKLLMTMMSMCLVIAFGVFGVLALKKVDLQIGGNISFEATGINGTVSSARGTGLVIPEGAMQGFTLTTKQEPQIDTLENYNSWSSVALEFVEDSEGVASLSFDITNTSDKESDLIKVELTVNSPTAQGSAIGVAVSDIAYVPALTGNMTTCTITFTVANPLVDATINFDVTAKLTLATASDIPSTTSYENLSFETNDEDMTAIASWKDSGVATAAEENILQIPALVSENNKLYKVTGIGSFENATITGIKLPAGMTEIPDNAFKGSSLTSIVIPEGVTTIGKGAFNDCANLESVSIPSTVSNIGTRSWQSELGEDFASYSPVFSNCQNLQMINVDQGNERYKVENNCLINMFAVGTNYSGTVLEGNCVMAGANNAIIPEGVVAIHQNAFSGRTFDTLNIPSSVQSIYKQAFRGASINTITVDYQSEHFKVEGNCLISKTDFSISDNYTTRYSHKKNALMIVGQNPTLNDDIIEFREDVFKDLTLDTLTFTGKLYDRKVFNGCEISNLAISENNTGYTISGNCIIKNGAVIMGCKNSIIPSDGSVTSISEGAFYGTKGLTSIVIPAEITSIAMPNCDGMRFTDASFMHCKDLISISVEDGNSNYRAVNNCLIDNNSKTIILATKNSIIPEDENVKYIGVYAFNSCAQSVRIPSNILMINAHAFSGRTELNTIELSEGLKTISAGAFEYTSISSITLPSTVQAISGGGYDQFYHSFQNTNIREVVCLASINILQGEYSRIFSWDVVIYIPSENFETNANTIRNMGYSGQILPIED